MVAANTARGHELGDHKDLSKKRKTVNSKLRSISQHEHFPARRRR